MAEPIITIENGKLRGRTCTDIDGRTFYSFQGIPYGKPPLGQLRFKAPRPAEPWSEIRDATQEGNPCLAKDFVQKTIVGSEDCLFLNVYTPKIPKTPSDASSKLPVMFWIHGGGFTSGSGNADTYGPNYLLTEDIVLVTINYRLGIFGFLSFDDPSLDIPGNAGLKDMVLALRWVQSNVSRFGGDPDNVTVFSMSAGAVAAHLLMFSPIAEGLFHKIIAQSGTAFTPWAKGRNFVQDIVKELTKRDENTTKYTNDKDIFDKLDSLTGHELFEISDQIQDPISASNIRPFGPVIERRKKGAFLNEDPLELLKSGKYHKVPFLLGFTNNEGLLVELMQKRKLITDFELTIPHMLKIEKGSDLSKSVASKIKQFYYGQEEPSLNNIEKYYHLLSDNLFVRDIIYTAKCHAATSQHHPVYLYQIAVESTLNLCKIICNTSSPGVCHGDDVFYLFSSLYAPEIVPGSLEETSIRRFVKLWTNFARSGDPNSESNDSLLNVHWEPIQKEQVNFLNIGDTLTAHIDPERASMEFWRNIFSATPRSKI